MITLFVKEARSLKEKVTGLIGKERPESLLIKTRFGIHTFGLKFPIDVLILDKFNKVALTKKNLVPNRIFIWNPKYGQVIELPSGTIKKKKIGINDSIEVRFLA